MCKFGGSCKYHHPKQGVGSSSPIALNFYGYPLRPVCIFKSFSFLSLVAFEKIYLSTSLTVYFLQGEKECSYYVKTGQCKFGVTCKYHHPQPAGIPMPGPLSMAASAAVQAPAMYPTGPSPSLQTSQQYGVIQGNWPVARPALLPGSHVSGSYGPMILPPGVVPVPGWTPYPVGIVDTIIDQGFFVF